MLEKNKDYVEFTLQYTTVERTRDKDYRQVCFNGYSDYDFPGVPMDVVCKEFDHKVVLVSKRDFDRLQAKADFNAELAKLLYNHHTWCYRNVPIEEYLTKRGFTCVAEAIDNLDATVKSYRDMFDGCEPAYVKQRIDEMKDEIEKLADDVKSWKNVTGYSTPEDYMHARISGAFHTPFDYTAAWQAATGCDTPDQVKSRIESLENAVRLTNRNMIKEIGSNIDEWQKATGCETPEGAELNIRRLRGRIDEMKEFAAIASNWTDRIVED